MAYKKGKIKKSDIDINQVEFAIDTALSWDGQFPKVGKGDFLVELRYLPYGDVSLVLVSRRYTEAVDARDAASIAKNAYAERNGYKKRDIETSRVDAVT